MKTHIIKNMTSRTFKALLLAASLAFSGAASAQLSLRDDLNRPIFMKKAATRVVTLSPSLTELLFAVGAGDLAVAVDSLSVYPPETFALPKVATGAGFSLDRISTLKPDLVLAWREGIRRDEVEAMASFGTTVFVASARSLDDVSRLLRIIGQLTGRDAGAAVNAFEERLFRLKRENAYKPKLTTFIEIWNRPLTTVSGSHLLSEALEICRAENVFGDLPGFAPKVSWEEVQSKNPFLIVGAGSAASIAEFQSNWHMRPSMAAVQSGRLLFVDDDNITRASPRAPEAIAKLCRSLDDVRAGRLQAAGDTVTRPAAAAAAMALKPSLGPFIPSLANPVSPPPASVSHAPAPPSPPAKVEPEPAALPAPIPAPPPARAPQRPSQYGL
jgi:iron complex transport system substrate-binding protein